MDCRTYHLYNDGIEIMIPSSIKPAAFSASSENMWLSKDKKTIIHVARGANDLTEENLDSKLDEYYKDFCRNVSHFDCRKITRRIINRRTYGEIEYLSRISGYSFYNIFLLGSFEGGELITTMQCIESCRAENEQSFGIISDSIRILRKEANAVEDEV